jgi:hypothetical protein
MWTQVSICLTNRFARPPEMSVRHDFNRQVSHILLDSLRMTSRLQYLGIIIGASTFLAGCASRPPEQPRKIEIIEIEVLPTSVDFGIQDVGHTSSREIVIANVTIGDANLVIGSARIVGEGFYAQVNQCLNQIIPTNKGCVIPISFTPTSAGRFSGTLSILSNASRNNVVIVYLSGTGRELRPPSIRALTESLDFGTVQSDSNERTLPIAIRNDGEEDLTIDEVGVTGVGFTVSDEPCTRHSIPPSKECSMTIRFVPPEVGSYSGVLSIKSNDPRKSLLTVSIIGRCESPSPPIADAGRNQNSTVGSLVTLDGSRSHDTGGHELSYRWSQRAGPRIALSDWNGINPQFTPSRAGTYVFRLAVSNGERSSSPSEVTINVTEDRPKPEDLGVFKETDGEGTKIRRTGTMNVGESKSYSLFVEHYGDLVVCITPGYELSGIDFAGECNFETDPTRYRRYARLEIQAGTNITQIRITRRQNSPDNFVFIFHLFPR